MTVKSYKLGPGTLTLGNVPLDVSAQIASCTVEAAENVSSGEDVELLNGETLRGDEDASYRFTIKGSLVQDLSANGVVDFTWVNKGTEQPFTFVPSTAAGREVTGSLVPVPLSIGGDVKKTAMADFTFRIIGEPDLGTL